MADYLTLMCVKLILSMLKKHVTFILLSCIIRTLSASVITLTS